MKSLLITLLAYAMVMLGTGFLAKFGWNLAAPVFHASPITYWEGVGVMIVLSIIRGGFTRNVASAAPSSPAQPRGFN